MNNVRSFAVSVLRAAALVAVGAVVLSGIAYMTHKSHTPYYAQLAAKAAKTGALQTDGGSSYGFTYTGNDTQ